MHKFNLSVYKVLTLHTYLSPEGNMACWPLFVRDFLKAELSTPWIHSNVFI